MYIQYVSELAFQLWKFLTAQHDHRAAGSFYIRSGDHYFTNAVILWNLVHNIQHKFLDDRTKRTGSCIPVSYTHLDVYKRQS